MRRLFPIRELPIGEFAFMVNWMFFQVEDDWFVHTGEQVSPVPFGTLHTKVCRVDKNAITVYGLPRGSHAGLRDAFLDREIKAFRVTFIEPPKNWFTYE